jgi:hypothetical protein
MKAKHGFVLGMVITVLLASSVSAEEKVYWDVVDKIMEEAFENSQVMENASWLTDVFGPRNSKSSGYVAATKWARERLEEYGLSKATLEPFDFGVGWENEYTSVHMVAPQYMPIIAYPAAWSAGTDGKIRAKVEYVNMEEITSEEDLERYRGKLKGLIVFVRPIRKLTPHFEPMVVRYTDEELDEMAKIPIGPRASEERRERRSRGERLSREQIFDFIWSERAVAIVHADSRNDFGTVDAAVNGYPLEKRLWETDAPPPITELIMAAEHYNRIMRILEKDIPVEMEMEIKARFVRGEPVDHNVVAEIPGTDLADELVLFGGHLQSEPVGTGATDNGGNAAVCMEVARIFQALDIKPRRTVRIGLWGGHEMGVIGNRSHVSKNFADVNKKEYKEDYHNLSAYFNVDAGSARIRGIPIYGNESIRAIFTEWMKPLHNLGMTHLLSTGSAHEAYTEVGLPGYYFLQDRMDPRRYHSNMDVYDRLVPEDLMANSVILATFVYHAAMRDEKLPRVAPLPW